MKRICFIALVFVLLAFPSSVRADAAPPIEPPGSNLQPGEEITQVRMAAETVVIEVQRDITPESLGRARITADFTMHNLGSADESMAVRFPISSNDGRGKYPEISNLLIQVNGKQVQSRRAEYPDINPLYQESVPWADFDVMFPAGQDVSIRVTYDLKGSGYYPFTAFYYILETGAGWKDTIGSADIILRLPYKAEPQNVVMGMTIGWAETTPGGVFQGNEVRWHFENFEPGADQPVKNMEFGLVAPSAWQNVVAARETVAKHPNDGEAWGMLGKAYKEVFPLEGGYRDDAAGLELFQWSVDAYEKCLALKPNDAQWHAGFAELLAYRAEWGWSPMSPETTRAMEEIRTALELAPNDPVVRGVAEELRNRIYGGIVQNGDSFDFPWLTQTPTLLPSFTPTTVSVDNPTATTPAPPPAATEVAQAVPTFTNAPEATPTPVPQKSSPLCGSAALLPLFVMLWFIWKRK